jgi:hypothetical protein
MGNGGRGWDGTSVWCCIDFVVFGVVLCLSVVCWRYSARLPPFIVGIAYDLSLFFPHS